MRLSVHLGAALLGLAFGLAGCDASSAQAGGAEQAFVLRAGQAGDPLLRKLQTAPTAVAYLGTRRIEQSWKIGDHDYVSSYREQVASDGKGRFALKTLELLAPVMPPSQEDLWRLLQESRAGFLFRYRDFRIHDPAQMARNYTLALLGSTCKVAGRDCDELSVALRGAAPFTYALAVDRETGLVLRCEQRDSEGGLMSLVEFESVEFAPQFDPQLEWHEPSNEEEALPLGARAVSTLGFVPRQPLTDGAKFRVLEASVVRSAEPSGAGELVWAKTVLTDGIESVIVLHGGPDTSAPAEDVVRISPSVGPWNHVEGTLHGERIMAIGRVSTVDLLDLVQSTFAGE